MDLSHTWTKKNTYDLTYMLSDLLLDLDMETFSFKDGFNSFLDKTTL